MNKRNYHIIKNLLAALITLEGIFLIIYSIGNGLTLYSVLDLLLDGSSLTLCDLSYIAERFS